MDLIEKLDKKEIKELFSKNWLTHDAMWYGGCYWAFGPAKANELNKMAVRQMAAIEIKRIMKLMDIPTDVKIETFSELAEILETAFHVVLTDFMGIDFSFPEKNVLGGIVNRCFAHDGVKKYDMISSYECGIIERVKGWLESIGIDYTVVPDFKGCLMYQNGVCELSFYFDLD